MKFKNESKSLLSFPNLKMSVEAGGTYETKDDKEISLLKRSRLKEVVAKPTFNKKEKSENISTNKL